MKPKVIITTFLLLCFTLPIQAQFLKKLKQKAENAAERTILRKTDEAVSKKTEKTIDDATSKKNKTETISESETEPHTLESANTALNKNTEAKKAFYREDVVIKLHENGNLNQTQFFDANQVAVKSIQGNMPKPSYIDSEGFIYGYKDGEYTKSSIVALQSQGMMVPTMLVEAYKLPPEPIMTNLQKQTDMGMTANPFNGIVEFAFVYKPEHFRYEDFKESKQTLRGKSFTKFDFLNEPGYEGSYVLFDDQDRLVEIFTKKADTGQSVDAFEMSMMPPGENLMIYNYEPVEVQLPKAREVRTQGQGLMEGVMGNIVKGGNQPKSDIDEDDYDTSNSKGQVKSVKTALKNHKVTINDLPEVYNFDWKYKTEMIMESKKKDVIEMTFLINEKATYQATQMVISKSKDMGNTTMLFDTDLNTMVMFMEGSGHKMLQLFPIPEAKDSNEKIDFNITELPSKTILGYNCKGLQMENEEYILQVYHATGTPITLNNFLSFSGSKNMDLPEIDPRIAKQFSNGLIMEMRMTDKKKSKNNLTVTAKSIDKVPTSLKKDDYQSMDMLSGMKMFNNK